MILTKKIIMVKILVKLMSMTNMTSMKNIRMRMIVIKINL